MKQPPTLERAVRFLGALLLALTLLLPAAVTAAPTADTLAPQTGTVSGVVYRDYNASGARDNTASFREPGIGGVLIRAYDANNALAGSGTSASDGTYSFTATGSSGFRVEFTLPTDGSMDYLQAGAAAAATGNTTVVFVPTGGQTGLNVGFNNPSDYSQADPPLITTRTAFGPRLQTGGNAGLPNWSSGASANPNESVIGIPYGSDGNLTNSNAHSVYATLRQTGTLYGLIYGRRAQLILAGTFFKSYADTGPRITGQAAGSQWEWLNDVSPLGAIYGIQPTALASNPSDIPSATNARVYANLNKIIDPTTGVIVPGNPAGVDPRRTGTINYDSGSFGDCDGPGAGGGPANPSSGNTCWHHDPVAWDKVGSIGLGDLEQDDAEKFVFVVNLGDKKLYQLPIVTDPVQWPVKTLAASPLVIPNTCAVAADAVPGGLGFKDGKLYIGVTCTAESSQNLADLKAEIWQFDPKTQAFSAAPVFSMPLGYPRGCIFAAPGTSPMNGVNAPKNVPAGLLTTNCQEFKDGSPNTIDNANWLPWPQTWQDMFEGNKGINSYGKPGQANDAMVQLEYPHPWLSDISFDGDDFVIGFRDTAGDRTGNVVRTPNLTTTTVVPATITNVDNFAAQNFTGSNGSTGWGANWSETGDDGSATTGDIQVLADTALSAPNYQLRISGQSNSIQRTASNTFSTGVGTLSFAYRRDGLENDDAVTVAVSTNNGSTWTNVLGISGAATDPTYRTAVIDINLSNQTIIRFATNSTMTTSDIVWIDNVRVTNQSRTWMSQYVYGNADSAYTGAGFGDLIRACKSGGSWTLESNGSCGGVTTGGANNGQGPGVGSYPGTIGSPFNGYGDGGLARFSNVADHPGVTNYDGNGNLLTTAGAVLTYPTILSDNNASNNSEAGLALKHTQLYSNAGSFFGKANGLGDVEALLNSPPLEIGNRVWCDTGVSGAGVGNGIQDPGEAVPTTAVTVRLTCGTEYAEVNTNTTTGAYLFTDAIWNSSANTTSTVIPRDANCKISIATTGGNATALTNACGGIAATVANADGKTDNGPLTDIRDSDSTVVRTGSAISSAEVSFLTGGPGVNNHSLDLAFGPERDWGDAPDPNYPTLISSNGARHTIVANKRMGATIDSEQNGQPNTGATGDDLATSDDEDGVTFGALAAGQPAIANIDMTSLPTGEVCRLNAWIDFNGNGSWLDSGEQIATNVALNGGAVQALNFSVPQAVTTSPTYARFRCSTQQNLTPTGLATDGEVEDYQVTIQQTGNLDYGDAPDPTYPTLSAGGGASHLLGATGPRLGACVDAETNGQPNTGATGDDAALGSPVFGACANNDDEDGVTIPTLTEGVQASLTVNVSQATCLLNAWVDWNGDGDWNDAGEQTATNAAMSIGANPLPVTPPAASTQATTYARFRCSTTSGLGSTGAAANGEVEDYAINVSAGSAANDWGDAPDTGAGAGAGNYQTVGTDNGAHHLIANSTWLGACVDAEGDGQPNTGATGDDTNVGTVPTGYGTCAGNDDEDGVTIPTLLAGQTAQIQVTRNASAAACSLNGWIDFNGDGDWNDTGEQVATNLALATGANNLNVAVPAGAVGGTTYARFRCSTLQNLKPTGVATDGEVEDYAVNITATAVDWGDLPDPLYPTLSASNGAAHALSGVAYLGRCVDAETNGQPNSTAQLDDTTVTTPRLGVCATGNDDEDGVTFGTLTAGQSATANIDMAAFQSGANVCFLNAWIDFNGNGLLTDAGEQIASNVQMVGGAVRAVNFSIPVAVITTPTGARFRCSTQSGLTPTGQANDGEVEDYMVTITPQPRDFGDAPDSGAGTGVGNYATTVSDNGPNHLIVTGLNLGNVAPDQDSGALQNVDANADDQTGTPDDEDGIATLPTILTSTTNLQMTVRATNSTGTAANLACWIDFNRDGSFLGAGEKSANVAVPASSGGADYVVNFSGFGAPVAGDSYIRCRIAYLASEISGPVGPAASGEIEDFKVTIVQPQDFGDLPDTTSQTGPADYQTLLANNGPRHIIVSGVRLGGAVDSELNGQPSTPATLDDTTGAPDDEDGVVFVNPLVPGKKATVQVTAGDLGCLNAWVDWNGNGALTDAGEQIATDLSVAGGVNPITINSVPAGTTGVLYSRFRLTQQCSQGGGAPTGPASSGEVEDYALATLGDFVWNDANSNGQQDDGASSGQSGVTVKLLDGSGNPVTDADGNPITVVTDANGKYEFPGLPPGTYIVEFVPPTGSGFTTPNSGNDATDSDADQTTGRTGTVTLAPGDSNTTVDAGLVPLPLDFGDLPDTTSQTGPADYQTLLVNNGARHVIVTNVRLGAAVDTEANGQPNTTATGDDANPPTSDDEDGVVFQTPLVPGFQGKIQVTANVAGCLNAWVDWNSNGSLTDANEQIATDQPVVPGPNTITINSVPANATGVLYSRFRFTQQCGQGANTPLGLAASGEVEDYALASLGDYVWNDTDKDGQQDGSEAGVDGVTVRLLDGSGSPVLDGAGNPITDVTANSGKYEFPGLPPGTYIVEFVPPAGNSFTQPDQGNDATDSDASVTTGRTPPVTLAVGDVNITLDAGLVAVGDAAIGNLVWCDLNGNGIRDGGELGQDGVTVRLYSLGPDNTPYTSDDVLERTLVTAGGGFYMFAAVPTGQYYVAVDETTVPPSCGTFSSAGSTTDPDIGDQNLPSGDDGAAAVKVDETVSGVITVAVGDQVTEDTGDPLGYDDDSSYMTVDFGFTTTPTSVELRDLNAAPQPFGERLLDLLRRWLRQ